MQTPSSNTSVSKIALDAVVRLAIMTGRMYWDGYYDSPNDEFRMEDVRNTFDYQRLLELLEYLEKKENETNISRDG